MTNSIHPETTLNKEQQRLQKTVILEVSYKPLTLEDRSL